MMFHVNIIKYILNILMFDFKYSNISSEYQNNFFKYNNNNLF